MQIVGISVSDEAISSIARRGTREIVVEWAERVLRRHVRREKSLLVRIKDAGSLEKAMAADGLSEEVKARIRKSFADKEPVYTLSRQKMADFLTKAADTMDWIESLPANDRRIRRIERMAWADAEKLSEAWHARLAAARKKTKSLTDGVKPIFELDEGAFVAELFSQTALSAEGSAMGHCVGGYWNRVKSGETRILSIRDREWKPHVTIELSAAPVLNFEDGTTMVADRKPGNGVHAVLETSQTWVAVQVRGKQNRQPVPRYAAMVERFLSSSGIPWVEYGYFRQEPEPPVGTPGHVTVYTVFGKHFLSAAAACEWGEERFKEEQKNKGKHWQFVQAYGRCGLADIHNGYAPAGRAYAFLEGVLPFVLEDFAQRLGRGGSVAVAMADSGLHLILRNLESSAANAEVMREQVFSLLSGMDARQRSSCSETLVCIPGGRDIKLVTHSLPLLPVFLLASGYADGLEDKVAKVARPHLKASLEAIAEEPGAVHSIKAAVGGIDADSIVKACLFCGLSAEYAAAMAAVHQGVRNLISENRLALKKARASGRFDASSVNFGMNMLAEGAEERLLKVARQKSGANAMLFSAQPPKPLRPPSPVKDEQPIKTYRLPGR